MSVLSIESFTYIYHSLLGRVGIISYKMTPKYTKLEWQESMNDVTIDCSLDIAIHPANSKIVLLTVPGVDGSVDGYENKYNQIAETIQKKHGVAVVRIANPFITSFHWESNIRRALEYIETHMLEITGHKDIEIRIMAHSAGAAIVAQIAWEYPQITRILLINPATKLGIEKMKYGLAEFGGNKITVLFGSRDPSVADAKELSQSNESARRIIVLDGVNHHFSGDALASFIQAPHSYLFD